MTLYQALTDKAIKAAKPETSGSRLTDGKGLYLALFWERPFHLWRFDYTRPTNGKRNTLNLGDYPALSLSDARMKAAQARALIAQGIDPAEQRDTAKEARKERQEAATRVRKGLPAAGSFKAVALEFKASKWRENPGKDFRNAWSDTHAEKWERILKAHVFPRIGDDHVSTLETDSIYSCIEVLETAGKMETAKCVRNYCKQVLDFAIVKKHCKYNVCASLGAVVRRASMRKHNPSPKQAEGVTALLAKIDAIENPDHRAITQTLALVWQRPGNVRAMMKAHIDFKAARWVIPSAMMKRTQEHKEKGHAHVVPLPRQALAIIKAQMAAHPDSPYVFPALTDETKPLDKANLSKAFERAGLRGECTPHGFRSMARTMLAEVHGFAPHVLEQHLAHSNGLATGTSYDQATYVAERTRAAQVWADYLDKLRGGKVVRLKRAA
jgi:integrase